MPFFVKRNGQAVPIVSDPNVINDTTASQDTAFSGSKVNNLIANHTHASNQINTMTGYSKPSSTSSITPADSLNTAIGKVEKGLEGKQSPLSLGQYSGLDREIQILDNEEVGQTWYNTGIIDIEPSSSEGKLTVSKVDDSVFPGSAPYTSEDIDIPGWEKVENSPVVATGTGSDITLSAADSTMNVLMIYGKSEVVDNKIISAGEGWDITWLKDLEWLTGYGGFYTNNTIGAQLAPTTGDVVEALCDKYPTTSYTQSTDKTICGWTGGNCFLVKDSDYDTVEDFVASLGETGLCYKLANPAQERMIAIKTDDGSGINGSMETFTTNLPLRGIPDTNVRDVVYWNGLAGVATKKCGGVRLADLTWTIATNNRFIATPSNCYHAPNQQTYPRALISTNKYIPKTPGGYNTVNYSFYISIDGTIGIKDIDYTTVSDFVVSLGDAELVYELAEPTTQDLALSESKHLANLRTFAPTTHIQNNAGADMTVEVYAGTINGQAIADKLDTLTPKVYSLFIAKTDWDEGGTVEIDVPGTFGYDIPSENYNQLVLSDEQTNYWRKFNVCLDHAHDEAGHITTIEFSCDYDNIPDRVIYFDIVSSRPKYVDWSGMGNLIVPPGLQVDTSLDEYSTNPVQNKTVKAALGNKADISALDNYVEKEAGKSLSTNDYTDADKALVQDSPITVSATDSDLTLSTSSGNLNALTVYGKSEVVDGSIKSAGEGWATVDLGASNWGNASEGDNCFYNNLPNTDGYHKATLMAKYTQVDTVQQLTTIDKTYCRTSAAFIVIHDTDYTDATAFKNSLNGVILAYQLADPTQGNCIAVKTDNGTGIDGTMAVFNTGTPLYGVDENARDVMQWDGSAGTVTKVCDEVDLGTLDWRYDDIFYSTSINNKVKTTPNNQIANLLIDKYTPVSRDTLISGTINKVIAINQAGTLQIRDTTYTDATAFKNSLNGVKLVYELATPTTTPLTPTENASIAALRTFTPQTHAQNNAGAEMTVEAYAGTANGRAAQKLENRIKSEIDEVKNEKSHFCYSYKIDMSDSNPATCVKPHFDPRYGCDNFNFTSAHMDYANDRFDYGSWEGFIRRIARPCMLRYDGTVDYYLDPDDYSKKITGEASDVADVNYQGNAMVELEKLYFKRYTHNGIQYCFIADRKLDKSFKCYAHHDKYGKELDYIYRAAYDGMYDGTRLRSISGIDYHNLNALTAGYIMSNAARQEEMNFAKANNVSTEQGEGWNILHKSEWDYINDILVLISMSTDTQGTFGRGRDSGYVSTSDTGIISTGTMDTKGLFWGKNDSSAGVKVLGIENHWANIWKSCAGWMLISNQHYTKMTFGTEDGSTGTGFNTDGTGYLATGASISANGYISDWAENDNGFLPTAASGSASTYRCDYVWQNTATYFALVGGGSSNGLHCGAFFTSLNNGAGSRGWSLGAALSYKPLSAA